MSAFPAATGRFLFGEKERNRPNFFNAKEVLKWGSRQVFQ